MMNGGKEKIYQMTNEEKEKCFYHMTNGGKENFFLSNDERRKRKIFYHMTNEGKEEKKQTNNAITLSFASVCKNGFVD